jgi:ACT domain-containing protein
MDEYDFTNKIIDTDILDSLYKIFDDIEETVYNTDLSYKKIQDDSTVFIMIDRELLRKILGKTSKRSRGLYKKSYK